VVAPVMYYNMRNGSVPALRCGLDRRMDREVLSRGQTVRVSAPLEQIPVFLKKYQMAGCVCEGQTEGRVLRIYAGLKALRHRAAVHCCLT
jgi:alpha-glucosidase (family GH31 glycosyl hydrolase)